MRTTQATEDHLYLRFRQGALEAVRHRHTRSIDDLTRAVNVAADYPLVLSVIDGKAVYDIAKSEDDTLSRLMSAYPSSVQRDDYLMIENVNENDLFRETWKDLVSA